MLLNKRLEYAIMQANTVGNIRVIDDAYIEKKVAPNGFRSLFLAFALSVFIAITVSIIRGLYFSRISNPAEIEDSGINNPVLGIFPNAEGSEDSFEKSIQSTALNLSILIDGINDANDRAIKVSVTSPSAANGKTLISGVLLKQFSELGKKTILVDADFKRGDQHKNFNVKKISKSDIDISETNFNIDKFKIARNQYLVPMISKLEGSFRFIDTEFYNKFINYLENNFDIIIFDTAPILAVPDTNLLVSKSDINLLLCKHQFSRISEIKHCIDIAGQVGKDFNGIIYNFYEKPRGYYGYYSYYGNYAYKYYADKYLYNAYEYKDEDKSET